MIDLTSPTVTTVLGLAQAAVTTAATMLTIGVAFLAKPGRASLYWSIAFALALAATYGVVASAINDVELLRRASLGAIMGAPAFLWSGFRALWGLRPHVWAGAALAVASAAALALVTDPSAFTVTYRIVFFAASVFAGLFALDWARDAARRRDMVLLPLAIMSLAFLATGAATLIAGLVRSASGGDDFALLRLVSSAGMLVYVATALVAIMGIATRDGFLGRSPAAIAEWQRLELTISDRLARAERGSEASSIVLLRLDDAADIRETAGAAAFASLAARFEQEVRAVFPPDSDVGSPSLGTVVVLVGLPDPTVRDCLRAILDRTPELTVDARFAIRPTVSAGWAPASVLGYDLDALIYTAREAATLASEKGGDRWERVSATIVQRLLIETAR